MIGLVTCDIKNASFVNIVWITIVTSDCLSSKNLHLEKFELDSSGASIRSEWAVDSPQAVPLTGSSKPSQIRCRVKTEAFLGREKIKAAKSCWVGRTEGPMQGVQRNGVPR